MLGVLLINNELGRLFMGIIPHPKAPWTSGYMVDRLREVLQNENLANWKKSYIERTPTGIAIVIPDDLTTNAWGARPHPALGELIMAGGWDGAFVEVKDVKLPYITFFIQPKQP
jgi:hypothetical protein